ncbi:MAG: putative extracellular nuclease [Thermoleophilia bacterium]|jgi:predicted extracellular nuclease|nr:putative extracellular nuclease [Thermoleophilia bacterium]
MRLMDVGPTRSATNLGGPVGHPAAAAAGAGSLKVAQMNLWNLFDTVDNPKTGDEVLSKEQYSVKLEKIAMAITELGLPDLISVNEIENEQVLKDLVAHPSLAKAGYGVVVREPNDERGINIGVLYRTEKLEEVGVESVNTKMSFPDGGRGQVDRSLLYARPPLVVDFKVRGAAQAAEGSQLLTIAVNHFKSKLGGAAPEARRQMQGQFLGEWLDARAATRPGGTTIVLGDLNAEHGEGAYEKLAKRADGSTRFYDAPLELPAADRYTYNYRGDLGLLDHMMVSAERKDAIKGVEILHVNTTKDAKKSQWDPKVLAGFSDHDPMMTEFDLGKLFPSK